MHIWIENQLHVWKTGMILKKDNTRAEIIEFYHSYQGKIHIRISGLRKKSLLSNIQYELDNIHSKYDRLKYKILVPCNCKKCNGKQKPHFFDLDTLERFKSLGGKIQCQNSAIQVEVQSLIDDFSPKKINTSNERQRRNEPDIEHLQKIWDMRNKKIKQLSIDLIRESSPLVRYHLEEQIAEERMELSKIDRQLRELE
jgi:internalin A